MLAPVVAIPLAAEAMSAEGVVLPRISIVQFYHTSSSSLSNIDDLRPVSACIRKWIAIIAKRRPPRKTNSGSNVAKEVLVPLKMFERIVGTSIVEVPILFPNKGGRDHCADDEHKHTEIVYHSEILKKTAAIAYKNGIVRIE
jgi:hypothetical protein